MSGLDFKFHHGGISVPNLDEAIAWYDKVLGFKLERRFPIPPIPAEAAILVKDVMRIELICPEGGRAASPERLTPDTDAKTWGNLHTAFAVKDVDETAEELRRHDVDIVWVKKNPFGANIFIRDPAGNLIEFVQHPDLFD